MIMATNGFTHDQNDEDASWFHGHISREDTERLLYGCTDGSFLIRESTNFPGDFTLCVAYQGKVEHYRIQSKDDLLTCDDEEFFATLPELVEHYTGDADGLCYRLVRPVMSEQLRKANMGTKTRHLVDTGWNIPRHLLRIGDSIGKGEFADVRVGWYQEEKVAVKVLKNSGKMADTLLAEASLMTSLRHPNLVQLLGVVLDDISQIFLVTEFMPNGSLVEYLRTRGRLQVTKKQQINFACDVCSGMAYLESKHMVHRDLAARNILLSEDVIAKVSDFGLAKEIDVNRSWINDSTGKFPIKWTAPEALRYSKFTSKSDVWSFGILLWEIYSFGRVPYPRIPVGDVIRHIEKGYRMEAPEGCPPNICSLMTQCWSLTPDDRPTFSDASVTLQQYRDSTTKTESPYEIA